MMNKLFTLLFLLTFTWAYSQSVEPKDYKNYPYWIQMMQDENFSFYETQKAFQTYWEGRPVTKSSGFKVFKRWEYMKQFQVDENGMPVDPFRTIHEFNKFTDQYGSDQGKGFPWTSLGPWQLPNLKGYKGMGRLNAIGFHPTEANILYVGAPSGGIWKSTDGGQSWSPLTDHLPSMGVSSIIVDSENPDIIFIGTGDRDAGDAAGIGVYRSDDAGASWYACNNGMGAKVVGRMIQHPADPGIIFAATSGGIFMTSDHGANWILKKPGNFKDILFKPDNPGIMYSVSDAKFYRSEDAGENWTQITAGLVAGQRSVIAVTPAAPENVYLLMSNNNSEFRGLYLSTDSGLNFTEQSNSPNILDWSCDGSGSGGQAWYDLEIAVDPVNPAIIFSGGVDIWKSVDYGVTWAISSHWWGDCGKPAVHADQHVFEYSPVNNRLYVGNDGGFYYTENQGASYPEISNGLVISQAYKIGQAAYTKNKAMNGYQDNGSASYNGTYWKAHIGGDGMECAVDPVTPIYSYGTLYYGDIIRIYNNGSEVKVAGANTNGITESGAWVTPFTLHKTNSNTMFAGYKNIWRCTNIKSASPVWEKISNNLGNSNSQDLAVLEHSEKNPNILYAGRYDKKLFRCDNVNHFDPAWTDLTNQLPQNADIRDIKADPFDENIVYLALGNKIYKSFDKGAGWVDISGNLPNIPLYTIALYKNALDGIYVGTDAGVYYKDFSMPDWMLFAEGLPVSVKVTEIEIYYDTVDPAGDRLRAGTYGRGMWEAETYKTTPVADFSASHSLIPTGCSVNFRDLSWGVPTTWQWTFEGGTPGTSNEKNPQNIEYLSPGTYDVTLTVTNSFGTDTQVYPDMITVSSDLMPSVNFTASETVFCTGTDVQFTDLTAHCPTAWFWQFTPSDVQFVSGTSAQSQNPVVRFSNPGTYTVSLMAQNSNGSGGYNCIGCLHSGGLTLPYSEGFEYGSLTEQSWVVENPDGRITWNLADIQGNPPSTKAAFMNNYIYNYIMQRDQLISPAFNLTGVSSATLEFKHAYAQKTNQKDSLIVFISTDCGENWTRLFAGGPNGSGIFETAPATTTAFIPQVPDDWCGNGWGASCIELDISPYTGGEGVKIMFEGYNRFGNNLYVDDIKILATVGTDDISGIKRAVHVYPNPAGEQVVIETSPEFALRDISVFNFAGNQVKHLEVNGNHFVNRINTSDLPSGIYVVRVQGAGEVIYRKMVKE